MKKLLPLVAIALFILGCTTQKISYNRNKILKYAQNYQIFLNNEKIDFSKTLIDKNNIKSVERNRQTRELKITSIRKTKLIEVKKSLDSIYQENISLFIIDGIPYNDETEKIKIDLNSIKSVTILNYKKNYFCNIPKGSVIVIQTK